MADPIVRLEGVGKTYRRDRFDIKVLSDVSLEVAPGEFLALMGPSGSGKSTLLNLLAGIDRPSTGRILVAGKEVTRLSESQLAAWRHRNIGFIFQFYNLLPVLNAFDNVELPLTLTKLSRAQRRKKVEVALEVVGLADRMKHYPRQLSGGQEQRVAIARAIVTDPTLLLADEPTGDLDAESAEEVLDLLGQLNRDFGKTIVMVTHDPHAAARASRLVRLEKGALVESQPAGGGREAERVAEARR
jgi:putative ABC transport system ATP-binding protein